MSPSNISREVGGERIFGIACSKALASSFAKAGAEPVLEVGVAEPVLIGRHDHSTLVNDFTTIFDDAVETTGEGHLQECAGEGRGGHVKAAGMVAKATGLRAAWGSPLSVPSLRCCFQTC